uniref:Uncharacterized protein n=1 Tax=Parascaris equorum TaxID=6256 RepID=A0A914S2W7_PAREQ
WIREGRFGRFPQPPVHLNRGEHFELQPAPPSEHLSGHPEPLFEDTGISVKRMHFFFCCHDGLKVSKIARSASAPYRELMEFLMAAFTRYRQIDDSLVQRLESYMSELDINSMIASECVNNETLRAFWLRTRGADVPQRDSWERFYADIGSCDLYRKEELLNDLLRDLNTLEVKNVAIMEGGTQVKLIITFGRDYESDPNHFYFSDFERHHAEIATFHLDKYG